MKLYAFSDFHLSGNPPTKPMDIFGDHWKNHREKIIRSWLDTIHEDDTVIIAGDVSCAPFGRCPVGFKNHRFFAGKENYCPRKS